MSNVPSGTSFEGDDTCSFEDTLLQSGDSTDSKGQKITLSSDDVRRAYADIMKRENHSIPYYAIHDGEEVARILKYKLVEDQDKVKILSKGVVHNPKTYYDRFSRGFIHTSPELTIHSDDTTNKIVMVEIDGAAMSKTPGMNPEMVITRHMNFSLDKEEVDITPTEETFDWKVPLTNLESKVDNITAAIKDMATPKDVKVEEKMTEESKLDMTTLSELIKETIKAEMAQASPAPTAPITVDPVAEVKEEPILDEKTMEAMTPELLKEYTAMAAEREALKQQVKTYEDEKERQAKAAYADILQKCKDLGIEKPENFVATGNLNTEQKTAMLSAFASEFVKKTALNTPQTESISNQAADGETGISIDTAMRNLRVSGKAFREEAMETGLFDKATGKWIGDNPSYA